MGFSEILVVLVIALLVFGPSKLPQFGEALGKGIRNFKKAVEEPDHVHEFSAKAEEVRQSAKSSGGTQVSETIDNKKV